MINLIYTSTATAAYSTAELNLLLAECRLRNTFLDITGILLYYKGSIMQILEGENDTVQKLYAQIRTDKRHTNVLTAAVYEIEKRNYVNWSMAFKEVSNMDWSSIESCMLYDVKEKIYPVATAINTQLITIIDSFINLSNAK